jgi:hypothetical protein
MLYLRTACHLSWCRRNDVFRMDTPVEDRDSWYSSATVERAVLSGIGYCQYHIPSWLDIKAENDGAILISDLTCSHQFIKAQSWSRQGNIITTTESRLRKEYLAFRS